MAILLRDSEILKLIGTVIIDGDPAGVRPNSYYLRLGSEGEFITTGKDFDLGEKKKKGIRVQPGHSVGVTALELIDFRRETVRKLFPECDLHGIVSPSTDLSREGVVAPTTQIDAGYQGTLNWTLTNASSEERRFTYKERLFRLTIFKLEAGETPENLYTGEYQSQTGYVRSRRQGPPVGMKDSEWEDGLTKGGPEDLLENLIKTGYPWHVLGQRLKLIDQQFRSVSDEYSDIHDAIGRLTTDINQIREKQSESPEAIRRVVREEAHDAISRLTADVNQIREKQSEASEAIRRIVREEAESIQNRWLVGAASIVVGGLGLVLSAISNQQFLATLKQYGMGVGMGLVVLAAGVLFLLSRRPRP
jgi:deoxycytidine triphosphate deaminase/predicted phage tail protein